MLASGVVVTGPELGRWLLILFAAGVCGFACLIFHLINVSKGDR